MQQRKPVAQVKMRNIITGNTQNHTFHQSDKIEVAEMSYKKIKYLYSSRGEHWFCDEDNPKNRFSLKENQVSESIIFIKPNSVIDALVYNENIIGVKIPIKVELKVVEAPPGIKGDTAQGGSKQVKLETGATINAPLFINQDDIIRVNTETKQYIERAEKAK
ncbi:elongation factor P [Candidatus Azambacteria bacterium]|nr:elongation factor P [Candidatus Azambacteria bacterium]